MSKHRAGSAQGKPASGPYRYENTRPFKVFALAALAALAAVSLIWWAWTAINAAMLEDRIAEPPDLKNVVDNVVQGGRELGAAVPLRRLDGDENDGSLASKDADDEEPIDDPVDKGIVHD